MFNFRRFWVGEPRHAENVSDEKCYLYRSASGSRETGSIGMALWGGFDMWPVPAVNATNVRARTVCAKVLHMRIADVVPINLLCSVFQGLDRSLWSTSLHYMNDNDAR